MICLIDDNDEGKYRISTAYNISVRVAPWGRVFILDISQLKYHEISYFFSSFQRRNSELGSPGHIRPANALQLKQCRFKTSDLNQFFQNVKSKSNESESER